MLVAERRERAIWLVAKVGVRVEVIGQGRFCRLGMRGFELDDAELWLAEEVAPLASMMAGGEGGGGERCSMRSLLGGTNLC